jgi:hypothetical protein
VSAEIVLPGSTVEYKLNYEFSSTGRCRTVHPLTRLELGYGDSYGGNYTRTLFGPTPTPTACCSRVVCHRPALLRELRRWRALGARLPRQHYGPKETALGSTFSSRSVAR